MTPTQIRQLREVVKEIVGDVNDLYDAEDESDLNYMIQRVICGLEGLDDELYDREFNAELEECGL